MGRCPPGAAALVVIGRRKIRDPDPPWLWSATYSDKFNRQKGLCMRVVSETGVRQKIALAGVTDTDAKRVFLELVRCGSFRSAVERLSP
jgi:hypothetical protein